MSRNRAKGTLRGLLALLTLFVLVIGLPIALYRFGGSPIPSKLPTVHQVISGLVHQDNGSLFIGAVKYVSWIAWLAFTIAVLTEAQAAIRGRRAPRLRLGGLQGMAGRLVALAALTFTTPAAVTLATSSAMAATVQHVSPASRANLSTHCGPLRAGGPVGSDGADGGPAPGDRRPRRRLPVDDRAALPGRW